MSFSHQKNIELDLLIFGSESHEILVPKHESLNFKKKINIRNKTTVSNIQMSFKHLLSILCLATQSLQNYILILNR